MLSLTQLTSIVVVCMAFQMALAMPEPPTPSPTKDKEALNALIEPQSTSEVGGPVSKPLSGSCHDAIIDWLMGKNVRCMKGISFISIHKANPFINSFNTWTNRLCSADECNSDELKKTAASLEKACETDVKDQNPSARALISIMKNFKEAKSTLCKHKKKFTKKDLCQSGTFTNAAPTDVFFVVSTEAFCKQCGGESKGGKKKRNPAEEQGESGNYCKGSDAQSHPDTLIKMPGQVEGSKASKEAPGGPGSGDKDRKKPGEGGKDGKKPGEASPTEEDPAKAATQSNEKPVEA